MRLRFRLTGAGAEKALNAARKSGAGMIRVRRRADRALTGYCARKDRKTLEAACAGAGVRVEWTGGDALFRAAERLRFRKGLVLGAIIFPAITACLLSFVWEVRVTGAGAHIGEIRLFLEENGVRPGARLREISAGDIQAALEFRLPRVQWARVTVRGARVLIDITEGVHAENAPQTDDLIASEGGLIARVAAFCGTPIVTPGEVVTAGQTLIAGRERGADGADTPVRAAGQVIARVWRQARATVSLMEVKSIETGRESERIIVETPFFSYARADAPDYLTADMTRRERALGAFLPVVIARETYREVALEMIPRDESACRAEAAEIAEKLLADALLPGDEVVDKWADYSMIGRGSVTATVTMEILRDIASPNVP